MAFENMHDEEMLLDVANAFHGSLQRLAYDMSASLMDEVENVLIDVLNARLGDGKVVWLGYGRGYAIYREL